MVREKMPEPARRQVGPARGLGERHRLREPRAQLLQYSLDARID